MTTASATPTPVSMGLLAVGGVVSGGALFVEAGWIGAAVALFGVAVAFLSTGFYGVALQHLGAVGLVPSPSLAGLVLLEAAAVFLLFADAPPGDRLLTGVLAVPLVIVGGVALATLAAGNGVLAAALVLVLVVAVGTYVAHRYTRVRLGIAAGELDA